MVTRSTPCSQRNGNQADVEGRGLRQHSSDSFRSSKTFFLRLARRRSGPDAIIWGMKTALMGILLCAAAMRPAAAQVPAFDTSGNGLLKGTYYFRNVLYIVGDNSGDLNEAVALYGTVTFSGSGTYTMSVT